VLLALSVLVLPLVLVLWLEVPGGSVTAAPPPPPATPPADTPPAPAGAGTAPAPQPQAPVSKSGTGAAAQPSVSRLQIARRITLRSLRRAGLAMTLVVPDGTGALRVRVLRGASGKSVYEESLKPAKSGAISIRLRSSALRRALGPGLYAIEVTAGRSATELANRHSRAYASYGSRRPDHTTSPIGRRGEGVWRLPIPDRRRTHPALG
jgi:hypothetical protein